MIDWQRITEIRDEVGAENFQEVSDLFLFEVEEELKRLRDITYPTALAAQLHFLKGSALNLGFIAFADICQAGESTAQDASRSVDIDDLLTCYNLSKREFSHGLHRFAAA